MHAIRNLSLVAVAMVGLGCGSSARPVPEPQAAQVSAPATEPEVQTKSKTAMSPAAKPAPIVEDPKVAEQKALRDAISAPEHRALRALGPTEEGPSTALGSVTATLAVTKVSGALYKAKSEHVLGMAKEAFQKCGIDTGLRRSTNIALAFHTNSKGLPSKIRVSGASPGLNTCVRSVLERMIFPDAPKSSSVVAALVLAPVFSALNNFGRTMIHEIGPRGTLTRNVGFQIIKLMSVGQLDQNVIRLFMRRLDFQFQHCYRSALFRKRSLAGKLSARFVVTVGGRTDKVVVRGVDPGVSQCVAATLRGMHFPTSALGRETRVEFDALLRPAPSKP